MPNECLNHITIVCHENPEQLQQLHDNELNQKNHDILHKSEQGIIVNTWTSWNPSYEWLDALVKAYPQCWVKMNGKKKAVLRVYM